ncbi:MAG: SH3 domain-containing protein [Campylobacterota bacterium]|nr:SH3 domain-containing protein [Campylobacterota bacterium]
MRHLSTILLGLLLLAGCSSTEPKVKKTVPQPAKEESATVKKTGVTPTFNLADLEKFPQNAHSYAANIHDRMSLVTMQKAYEQHYFKPWNIQQPPETKSAVMWPFRVYTEKGSFGENLKPLPKTWFELMLKAANFEQYGTINRSAITLQFSHLRNFPTHKPLFRDPSQAGEGFPFDYLQNSGVHANEPLFVSHYSKDGAWVYVFSSYATGWLPAYSIAYMKPEHMEQWQQAKQLHLITDNYPIKDEKNHFVFYGRIGVMLPLVAIEKSHYVALAVTAGRYSEATYTKVVIPRFVGREEVLPLSKKTLPDLANELMQSNYGWGGLYEERDCSSTIRDLYAPFGIWLPRNSSQQSRIGKKIMLKDMSRKEKIETIVKFGVPFETLLYRNGHILLYLGIYEDQVMVMHNVWGVKTMEDDIQGRKIVGKTIISTLNLGCEQEDYDEENNLLKNLVSMNIITASREEK